MACRTRAKHIVSSTTVVNTHKICAIAVDCGCGWASTFPIEGNQGSRARQALVWERSIASLAARVANKGIEQPIEAWIVGGVAVARYNDFLCGSIVH